MKKKYHVSKEITPPFIIDDHGHGKYGTLIEATGDNLEELLADAALCLETGRGSEAGFVSLNEVADEIYEESLKLIKEEIA